MIILSQPVLFEQLEMQPGSVSLLLKDAALYTRGSGRHAESWAQSRGHYIPGNGAGGQLSFVLPTSASCLSIALRSGRAMVGDRRGEGRVGVAWGINMVCIFKW